MLAKAGALRGVCVRAKPNVLAPVRLMSSLSSRGSTCWSRVPTTFAPKTYFASEQFRSFSSGHTVVNMPSLSPTMTKGNISTWNIKVGDKVAPGKVLADIETDKATMEFECMEEGFVSEILVAGGSRDVPVGKPIIVLVDTKEQVGKTNVGSAEAAAPAAAAAKPAAPASPAPSAAPATPAASLPRHNVVTMPALSPTMTSGKISKWNVKVGDRVKAGTLLASVETDKAVMDFEFQDEGIVAKLLVDASSADIKLHQPVMIVVDDPSHVAAFANYNPDAPATTAAATPSAPSAPASAAATTTTASAPSQPAQSSQLPSGRVIASPLAKKIASEKNVSLQGLQGTGPNGRIIQADVLEFVSSGRAQTTATTAAAAQPTQTGAPIYTTVAPLQVAAGEYQSIPHTTIRRITAQRLTEAKQSIPHFYLTTECRVDSLLKLRAHLNASLETKVSINDMVIKAAAAALVEIPEVNSSFHENEIRLYRDVNISVATQTEAGLMVPVIRQVQLKGLKGISADMKELATKAKSRKITPQDMEGGTFTISNLGMFGIKQFSAIINPPQTCILAVGASEERVVANAGKIEIANVMNVTLSCDHRAVDGVLGAQWLKAFKKYIEDPSLMLL
eukprot:c3968_g1_i1.p1 GENE.c3968_g1_i1~~c3968_g1_i1.p1  ORF type:complete len:620 (-),score=158.64 c3968_g1_i1:67-1926(-)